MTTPARIAANRRNALKSTGPRTPHGKALAGRNSLRHGFRSRNALLPGENSADFLDLLNQLRAEFAPVTASQEILVDQMAVAYWKLARVQRIENQVYRIRSETTGLLDDLRLALSDDDDPEPQPDPPPPAGSDETLGAAYLRDSNSSRAFISLATYEARLERSFLRAFRELSNRTQSSPVLSTKRLGFGTAETQPIPRPQEGA